MSNSARLTLPVLLVVCVMVYGGGFLVACSRGRDAAALTSVAVATATALPHIKSLACLQTLLESGVADGRIKQGGEELLQINKRVQEAFSSPTQRNTNTAKQQLLIMQVLLVHGIGDKTIDSELGQAVLASIDTISREYNLQLPNMLARPGT